MSLGACRASMSGPTRAAAASVVVVFVTRRQKVRTGIDVHASLDHYDAEQMEINKLNGHPLKTF